MDNPYIEAEISDIVKNGRFLVIGGAGTIGSAICRELFASDPKVLHVVDISENNMVELVELFNKMLLEFNHKETGNFLDDRM